MKHDGMTQVRGKCQFWRERLNEDDRWDPQVKPAKRRVDCSCFVEGDCWESTIATLPSDCPQKLRCRYYMESS